MVMQVIVVIQVIVVNVGNSGNVYVGNSALHFQIGIVHVIICVIVGAERS